MTYSCPKIFLAYEIKHFFISSRIFWDIYRNAVSEPPYKIIWSIIDSFASSITSLVRCMEEL